MLKWPDRSPQDVLDYGVDWSARLTTGESIVTATAIAPAGLEVFDESIVGDTQTLWIRGAGAVYAHIELTITTSLGRTWGVTVRLDTV